MGREPEKGLWENLPPELRQQGIGRDLAAGQILFQQGESAQALFWVRAGRLRLVSFIPAQVITHYTVTVGESLAETALYFDTYGCTAIADRASQVIEIPKQAFLEALHQSCHLSGIYVAHLTQRFHEVKTLLELRSIRSARERVLHYLTHRSVDRTRLVLDRPLKSLAGELGLTPEGLSRILSRLEVEGLISRRKRSILIHHERLGVVTK